MNDSVEVWKVVDNYPMYEVSSHGRVRSWSAKKQGKCLRLFSDRNGYLQVKLFTERSVKTIGVHVLVLTAFVSPRPDGSECRHLDGNPKNNSISNLKWGTKKENGQDRVRHGTTVKLKGAKNPFSKVSEKDVKEMRELASRHVSYAEIGRRYGVTGENASMICQRKAWKHVE